MTGGGRSFGAAAGTYAVARPAYPPAALDWLVPPTARRVLDVGAGTGKLPRLLVDAGLDVAAVEPSPQMAAQLSAYVPEADLRLGTAEDIPLPDGDVDAVLAGSAFHWFDAGRAVPEFARGAPSRWPAGAGVEPAGPGRGLGPADGRHQHHRGGPAAARPEQSPAAGGPFGSVQTASFPHAYALTRASLAALIQTFSYYLLLDTAHRAELLRRVDELVRDHPDLAGRDTFDLPYLTRCWRAHRG